jgi:hypothetical protein
VERITLALHRLSKKSAHFQKKMQPIDFQMLQVIEAPHSTFYFEVLSA